MLTYICPYCKAGHVIDETCPPISTRNSKTRDSERAKGLSVRNDLIHDLIEKYGWSKNQVATKLKISRRFVDSIFF